MFHLHLKLFQPPTNLLTMNPISFMIHSNFHFDYFFQLIITLPTLIFLILELVTLTFVLIPFQHYCINYDYHLNHLYWKFIVRLSLFNLINLNYLWFFIEIYYFYISAFDLIVMIYSCSIIYFYYPHFHLIQFIFNSVKVMKGWMNMVNLEEQLEAIIGI